LYTPVPPLRGRSKPEKEKRHIVMLGNIPAEFINTGGEDFIQVFSLQHAFPGKVKEPVLTELVFPGVILLGNPVGIDQ
jgi:hypothetical protein